MTNQPATESEGGRWALWRWFNIARPGQPIYLRRLYVVQTPWFAIFLHNIRTADPDLDRHDHPWDFWSFVLRGGYTEEWQAGGQGAVRQRHHDTWSLHRMRAEDAHRIVTVGKNTWTLVIVGRRRRDWGFWRGGRWVLWTDYLRSIGMLA